MIQGSNLNIGHYKIDLCLAPFSKSNSWLTCNYSCNSEHILHIYTDSEGISRSETSALFAFRKRFKGSDSAFFGNVGCWFGNVLKRQVKTPNIYFRDSGILLTLLGLPSEEAMLRHPSLGAIWEGFALEQVIQTLELRSEEAFFWRTSHGAELDLLTFQNGKPIGFEFKFADAPRTTKSMHQALKDLELEHQYVIYPGQREIPLADKITAVGLEGWAKSVYL